MFFPLGVGNPSIHLRTFAVAWCQSCKGGRLPQCSLTGETSAESKRKVKMLSAKPNTWIGKFCFISSQTQLDNLDSTVLKAVCWLKPLSSKAIARSEESLNQWLLPKRPKKQCVSAEMQFRRPTKFVSHVCNDFISKIANCKKSRDQKRRTSKISRWDSWVEFKQN